MVSLDARRARKRIFMIALATSVCMTASTAAAAQTKHFEASPVTGEAQPPSGDAPPLPASSEGVLAAEAENEIVVTGLRGAQRLRDIPRAVTVLNEAAIEAQLDTSPDLQDLIARLVPGVATADSRTVSLGQNTLRGRRMQVVVNGVVLNSPFLDIGGERSSVALEAVEAVEAIRGGTAVYGFGAAGGVINIRTRNPLHERSGVHSSFQLRGQPEDDLGDSLAFRTGQRLTYSNGNVGIEVIGVYERTQAAFDGNGSLIPSSLTGLDSESYNLGVRGGVRIADGQELVVGYNRYRVTAQSTTAAIGGNALTNTPARAVDLGLNVPNQAVFAISQGADLLPNFRSAEIATAEYTNNDLLGNFSLLGYWAKTDGRNLPQVATIAGRPTITFQRALDEKWGLRATFDTPFQLFGREHNLVWGFDYQNAFYDQPLETPGAIKETPPIEQDTYAAFAQLTLRATDRFTLNGGARFESAEAVVPNYIVALGPRAGQPVAGGTIEFSEFIFNLGFVYRFSDAFNLYGSFAQGFGIPEVLRGLRGTSALSVAAAIEAQPQQIDNYEIGIRGRLADSINYSAAIFTSTSSLGSSLLVDPVTLLAFLERAPEEIRGAEFTLHARVARDFSLGGSLTVLEGEREVNGASVPLRGDRIPPTKITFYADYRLGAVDLHLDALYGGSRNPFPGSATPFEGNVSELFLMNASASVDLGPGRVTLAIENLLDKQYVSQPGESRNQGPSYVAEAGRTFALTYRINW